MDVHIAKYPERWSMIRLRGFTNPVSHNTNVTYTANWTRNFMTEVLGNPKFNNTCVLITFDENEGILRGIEFSLSYLGMLSLAISGGRAIPHFTYTTRNSLRSRH